MDSAAQLQVQRMMRLRPKVKELLPKIAEAIINDHLILYASFLDRCYLCMNRTHDADLCDANALGSKASPHRKECQSGFQLARKPRPPTPNYFFTPRTASFAALATRNLTTVLAGIFMFCCVLGLKPVRAFLFCFTSLPKPGKTNSPFILVVLHASALSVSRNTPVVFLLVWVASARAS